MSVTRRRFLTYLGMGTYGLLRGTALTASDVAFPLPRRKGAPPALFKPILPSREDRLLVPDGYRYNIVCKWQDSLGSFGPLGAEQFGYDNDFLAYFPIDVLTGGTNSGEGLLWVNHETIVPLIVSKYTGPAKKTEEQIVTEKLAVGGSVLHVRRENGAWKPVPGSKYTRRFTALYPQMAITGPAAELVPQGTGTLGNCSGGRTPWYTALSCEEQYLDFNNPIDASRPGKSWADVPAQRIDETQYGWVVEIDPFGELPPLKHSCLGRFAHENTAWRLGPTGRLVIYMGDDSPDQFFYKFVSAASYDPKASRADRRKLLTNGTLYAADFERGKWLPLDIRRSKVLAEKFKSQGDVLLRTREAAALLKATPLDRPEDCEVHPLDGTLYIALSNNVRHGNLFGQIVRLVEDHDNPEGESFRFEIFLAGGPQSGLACPDNLLFDRQGNLWVAADIGPLNRRPYQLFGNNGFYLVPTSGPATGDAFQFASGPVHAELTGPWFTEDEATLFLSVQHPGGESTSLDALASHWPDGGDALPRPAVVAITGFKQP
jgi:secreted PhoX family phosphatase